jgi:hypothetical protein
VICSHTKPDDFSLLSTSGSRQNARWPLNPPDVGKHRLFRNPEKRSVPLIAGLAAAWDDLGKRGGGLRGDVGSGVEIVRTSSVARYDCVPGRAAVSGRAPVVSVG